MEEMVYVVRIFTRVIIGALLACGMYHGKDIYVEHMRRPPTVTNINVYKSKKESTLENKATTSLFYNGTYFTNGSYITIK